MTARRRILVSEVVELIQSHEIDIPLDLDALAREIIVRFLSDPDGDSTALADVWAYTKELEERNKQLDTPPGLDILMAEKNRLQALVGDESAAPEGWSNIDRTEAIRQAESFHAGMTQWMEHFETVREERDLLVATLTSLRHKALSLGQDLEGMAGLAIQLGQS